MKKAEPLEGSAFDCGNSIGLQQAFDGFAFFDEFFVGGGDFFLGEVVEREARDDFVTAGGGGADGHAGPDVGVEAVFAVRFNGDGMDFAGGDEIADVIDEGVGGGCGGGGAAGGDDGGSALADGFLEILAKPFMVADDVRGGLVMDLGEVEGGEHSG